MVIITLDVETKGLNAQEFILGCVLNERKKEKWFYKPDDMWNHIVERGQKLKKHKKKLHVYAHNHQFDFYSYAQNNLLNEKLKFISFRPFIAIYDENIYFLDTMAFYPMSLERVGEIVGLKKLETPKELTEGSDNINVSKLKQYCLRDTQIVMESIIF